MSERPMFASVGRSSRPPGETRSRAVLLLVAVGLAASTASFFWEQHERSRIRVVEVSWIPGAPR
jgi:hypothetical protein